MSDRIQSDHPSVETFRATLARSGSTHRPALELPEEAAEHVPKEGVVRLVVGGTEYHAPIDRRGEDVLLRGAYDDPRRAREREGTDHLAEWVESSDLEVGRSVHFDVVVEEVRYGLRAPGADAVYDASRPKRGLQDIARDLTER